jgi:hypothetical protein
MHLPTVEPDLRLRHMNPIGKITHLTTQKRDSNQPRLLVGLSDPPDLSDDPIRIDPDN